MDDLSIDKQRLWSSLQTHARIGATPGGGVNREALTDADRQGRDLFVAWCRDAGMDIGIDNLGNIYATRPGEDAGLDPVAVGSHLDTQPTGGKYDGILGVLGGLEVVRALNDAGIRTRRPITVIDWTNEEGSRFVPSMVASGVYAGIFDESVVDGIADREGVGFRQALRGIGYEGSERVGERKFSCHLELHIEQGPLLESRGMEIGVVTGSQAMDWGFVTIGGRAAHAGTTPMSNRLDPMAAATRLLSDYFAYADTVPDARATFGVFEALPGSHSTIPHTVRFTCDLRHPDPAVLSGMASRFDAGLERVRQKGYVASREHFGTAAAQVFDQRCTNAIREAAIEGGWRHCDIVSGAGHDAVYVNHVCPTGMIFVPCENGVSHNPAERITPEQAHAGVDVLLRAVMKLAEA